MLIIIFTFFGLCVVLLERYTHTACFYGIIADFFFFSLIAAAFTVQMSVGQMKVLISTNASSLKYSRMLEYAAAKLRSKLSLG